MNRKEVSQMHQVTYDIYVGNVPKNIEEDELKLVFSKYGDIKQVLCRWKEDFIGYAIVKFLHKLNAERLLRERKDISWNGHIMPIKAARRSDHNQQNGNGIVECRPNPYPETNKNQFFPGYKYSNTDYGYFQHPSYPDDQPPLSQPMMMEVLCTSVEDSITFYGCPVNRSDELMLVINSLRTLNFNQNRLDRKPSTRKVYAALFSEDKSWYRCSVIHSTLPNKPGMCSVRYIDYGNQEDTSYRNIVELPESLQNIPPFASKFTFSNLICENKSSNKKSCLHQLVNKRMSLSAYFTMNSQEYQVVKCSCNGKDVIAETINKGFAKSQRSLQSKQDSRNADSAKSKPYISGPDTRSSKPYNNDHPQKIYIPKPEPSQISMNGGSTNCTKSRKILTKAKDIPPKNEELHCNGVQEETKKDADFHPKMIIKRGSELNYHLNDVVGQTSPTGSLKTKIPKKPSQQNFATMIDTVIPNLKLINNIRSLVSQSCDDSIINYAVELLKNEMSFVELADSAGAVKSVNESQVEYVEVLNKIRDCYDKAALPSLKERRDACRNSLCDKLKAFISSCDNSIFERKEKIQKTITDLESNSNAWMNVQLNKKPSNIEELIQEYKKVKDDRWNLVMSTREITNQKHKEFMDILTTLQKEFYLNTMDGNETADTESNVCNISKTFSYSDKLSSALTDLSKSVDEEICMLTLKQDSSNFSVMKCLSDILDTYKEKIDFFCELYENRFAMLNELSKLPDVESTVMELAMNGDKTSELVSELSNYRENEGNEEEFWQKLTVLIKQLHKTIVREDYLKVVLAKAAEVYFPELNVEYPELKLSHHFKNGFLLKNWKPEYFLQHCVGPRGSSSFVSFLLDEPVVLKEYTFSNAEELNTFIQKTVLWNSIKSDHLVKVKAIFPKDQTNLVAVLPPVSNTLLETSPAPSPSDGERGCRILRRVLSGLRDIHAHGLVHHSIHPSTILIENEKALLDFCFDPKYLDENMNLKGINFLPPENKAFHESADMYGFGCLVLIVLFPNLTFTATPDGVPNVSAFRSIVEEFLLPKDYALLCALVDADPARRPPACTLLSKCFLAKYEAYCRSICDNQKAT